MRMDNSAVQEMKNNKCNAHSIFSITYQLIYYFHHFINLTISLALANSTSCTVDKHTHIHTLFPFIHNELSILSMTLITSPYLISIVDVGDGVLEIRKNSLQRTGAEFSMEPLVVEEHVFVEVLESPCSDQVVRQLSELEVGWGFN